MSNKFSVLLPVYKKDDPEYLGQAIDSVLNQTLKPDEVVVVVDGEISKDLKEILNNPQLNVHFFEKNRGLGAVLSDGIKLCKNEIIARMDADDLSINDRFEKQMNHFINNPHLDILGGYINEFYTDEKESARVRQVPCDHKDIVNFAKRRNPMNHVTVMYKKSSVLAAGNYKDMFYFEDYYLWIRMLSNGCEFENIAESLVNVRIEDFDTRRGGVSYIKYEYAFYRKLMKEKHINFFTFIFNITTRIIIRIAGSGVRNFVYNKILRKQS